MDEAVQRTQSGNAIQSQMFAGWKIWFSQRVPQRSRFIDDVKSHGGIVVPLEKQADIRIVDHARKEQPPSTHSYTFIERSVRNGALENPDNHAVGSTAPAVRTVGSITQPAKAVRAKYTAADDRILWNWVQAHPQKSGGTDGNEIYKQLEIKHPQHPWQSWRDRYIKKLKDRPRPYAQLENASPTPSIGRASSTGAREVSSEENETGAQQMPFTEDDAQALLKVADVFMNIQRDKTKEAWQNWSEEYNEAKHSPAQWQRFWETQIKPRHLARQEETADLPDEIHSELSQQHLDAVNGYEDDNRKLATRQSPSQQAQSHVKMHQEDSLIPRSGGVENQEVSKSRKRKRHATENSDRSVTSRMSPIGSNLHQSSREQSPVGEPSDAGMVDQEAGDISNERMWREMEAEDERSNIERILPVSRSGGQSDTSESRHWKEGTQDLFREKSPVIDFDLPSPYESADELPAATAHNTASVAIATPGSPEIDFELAPPYMPDGADFPELDEDYQGSELSANARGSPDIKVEPTAKFTMPPHIRSTIPDTQAILQAETQTLDLDVVEPDGGFDSHIEPPDGRSPQQEKSESNASSDEIDEQVDEWIQSFVKQGFAVETVTTALMSTSLDLKLAEEVLAFMDKAKAKTNRDTRTKLPQKWGGVWTPADDEALQSPDGRNIARLQEKHGSKAMQARWEFMEYYESC